LTSPYSRFIRWEREIVYKPQYFSVAERYDGFFATKGNTEKAICCAFFSAIPVFRILNVSSQMQILEALIKQI